MIRKKKNRRYSDIPVEPSSTTTWQTENESAEDFLGRYANPITMKTHYLMMKNLSDDINELRANLKGYKDTVEQRKDEIIKKREENR